MRIAVTGGAGFIGSNLAELLIANGHEVSVFDNLETGFFENIENLECRFIQGDLTDIDSLREFFNTGEFDYCFHLAALGSVPRSIENPRASFNSNVLGTLNLLEISRSIKLPIIYSSSSSVYGSNTKLPKNELDWMSPISPYGSFKSANESMMMAFSKSYGFKTKIFRLFNVYGPRQNPLGAYSAVIPRWTLAAFKKEPIVVFGDGNQKRDFTYVGDVNRIFVNSLVSEKDEILPINLAFGNPVTLNQMLEIFREYFPDLTVKYDSIRHGDIRDSESDPTKLRSVIGDFQATSLKDGLLSTFDWYKAKYGF